MAAPHNRSGRPDVAHDTLLGTAALVTLVMLGCGPAPGDPNAAADPQGTTGAEAPTDADSSADGPSPSDSLESQSESGDGDDTGGTTTEPTWPEHCPGDAAAFPIGTPVWIGGGGIDGRLGVTLDGLEWQDSTTVSHGPMTEGHTRTLIRGVGYGDGVFVAVGGFDNPYISTSCDGVTWRRDLLGTNTDDELPLELSMFLSDVAFADGVFVAAGAAGSRMRSADHGQTWVETGSWVDGHLRGIAAGQGRFVAAGHTWETGEGLTTVSVDGLRWTPVAASPGGEYMGVTFGAGVFISLGALRCDRSPDGELWEPCGLPPVDAVLTRVQFSRDRFYVQTGDGHWTSSPDGETWTPLQPGWLPDRFVWGEGRHVMVRWGARGHGLPPERWTEVEFAPDEGLGDLVFGHVADPA